ncbi:MAG: transketolase, partial [Deltaproteobacteria bacterium]|nr:transketolase [Deltaproteobacteria bacterium]
TVIRPADANETADAWKAALSRRDGPVALIFSRQNLPVIDRSRCPSANGAGRGAYILADPAEGALEAIIIATGSEVHLALGAYEELSKRGMKVRVVSMPSWEIFESQDEEYKMYVLPPRIKTRLIVEAASPMGWHRYAGDEGEVMGIERFGASAPYKTIFEKFGFTVAEVSRRAAALINKKKGLFLDRL